MSGGAWARVAVPAAAALGLLLALPPPRPADRLAWALQPAIGALAGACLYLLATARGPRHPVRFGPAPVLAARCGVLGLLAAGEEIVWRRVALGELLVCGPAAAFAGSTLGFALAHRARQGLHVVTGATFGGLYLATGGLAVSVAAHAAYNVLLASRRTAAGCPP